MVAPVMSSSFCSSVAGTSPLAFPFPAVRMSSPRMVSPRNSITTTRFPRIKGFDSDTAYDRLRGHFPYFDTTKKNPVFMENAGGSQCPEVVIDAIAAYMKNSYVQVGANYELSNIATNTVESAHAWMKVLMNAGDLGDVVFGSSTSQLFTMLSYCYGCVLKEGDEIIVHEANHEANAGPWVRMAEKGGFLLKIWKVNYETFDSSLESLSSLLSPRTRIVAVAHVSNILGEILDLEKVVNLVKEKVGSNKVRIVADGVAYAPHRAIDVAKWGVDWYGFSTYKVYGPHMAVLFGTNDAFNDVKEEGPNFYFISTNRLPYKFELGCLCHEACAGLLALPTYLKALVRVKEADSPASLDCHSGEKNKEKFYSVTEEAQQGGDENHPTVQLSDQMTQKNPAVMYKDFDRTLVEEAFNVIALLERPLQEMLLSYLNSRPEIVIIGPTESDISLRVPTISFIHKIKRSSEITRSLLSAGFALRNGHMYAHRLISALHAENKLSGNSVEDGVVRVSMVHYNTPSEVANLISCLDSVFQ